MIGVRMEKELRALRIDRQFKDLIRPLYKKEYYQLEENIIAEGCRDPIIIWNGIIIDGHNRYAICMRHNIPFFVEEKVFTCREEAIAWICANQLGRRNICEETRRYLIGKQYEAEKLVSKIKNPKGINQHTEDNKSDADDHTARNYGRSRTASRIAEENNISRATVEKYAKYSRAVDRIAEHDPSVVRNIISGQYKISQENIVALSKLSPCEIREVTREIKTMQTPVVHYNKTRDLFHGSSDLSRDGTAPTIKDMPAFDPDADINVLSLTVPSWTSSIDRVLTKTDLTIVSLDAKHKLLIELNLLVKKTKEMITAIEVT